jgi:outer membrane protein assembly factor BamB
MPIVNRANSESKSDSLSRSAYIVARSKNEACRKMKRACRTLGMGLLSIGLCGCGAVLNEGIRDTVVPTDAKATWQQDRYDKHRRGRADYAGSQTGALLWSYCFWSPDSRSQATFDSNGHIYLGSDEVARQSGVYCFNSDGSIHWSFFAWNDVDEAPALGQDGSVYVANFGSPYAIVSLSSEGAFRWSYQTGVDGSYLSDVLLDSNDRVYVGSDDNNFYALDSDGTFSWSYTTPGNIRMAAASDTNNRVFFSECSASGDHPLYAVDSNGSFAWSYYGVGFQLNGFCVDITDNRVFMAEGSRNLCCLNSDGRLRWSYSGGGGSFAPVIGADRRIYFDNADRNLYAITSEGALLWSYKRGSYGPKSPAVGSDGKVYTGNQDHNIYCFDSDGSFVWSYETAEDILGAPSIHDGKTYVPSYDNYFYVFGD